MSYKIDKNIPLSATDKYPFSEMEVGDSFAVSIDDEGKVRSASQNHGRKHGKKFSIRKFENAYRCWRIQ